MDNEKDLHVSGLTAMEHILNDMVSEHFIYSSIINEAVHFLLKDIALHTPFKLVRDNNL